MKLGGKVAIVTGAGRGLGRAAALALAKAGAQVGVNALHADTAESTSNEIKALGGRAVALNADVTKSDEVNQVIKKTMQEFKRIDILVNCAGASAREEASLFKDSREDVWTRVIDLNLKSVLICTRAVINYMIEQKAGKIINISSTSGKIGDWGLVDYSAAKAGVIGFTRALALEVAPYGINVNAICPGQMESGARAHAEVLNPFFNEVVKRIYGSIPMGRRGKPEEVAEVVVFLASDESSYITGQSLCIDGGLSPP